MHVENKLTAKSASTRGAVPLLTAEAVKSAALPLQCVHHIHGGDCFPLGVLGVSDGVADDILQEHLQDAAGLLVDEAGDSLHAAAASQAADSWLGDPLDVISQYFAVALRSSFPQAFASFSASGHFHQNALSLSPFCGETAPTPLSSQQRLWRQALCVEQISD